MDFAIREDFGLESFEVATANGKRRLIETGMPVQDLAAPRRLDSDDAMVQNPAAAVRAAEETILLAVGFNPSELMRMRRMLYGRMGFCRLLEVQWRRLLPSRELMERLQGSPLGDYEARNTKREIGRYPTASRDGKGNQPEEKKRS